MTPRSSSQRIEYCEKETGTTSCYTTQRIVSSRWGSDFSRDRIDLLTARAWRV